MTTTTAPTGTRITAAEVREGDLIQQAKKFWPAQTVTSITDLYGTRTFNLSGGSRVTGVAMDAPFIRYNAEPVTLVRESLTVEVSVDLTAWMLAYGQTEEEARADVKEHLTESVQHAVKEGLKPLEWFVRADTSIAPF